MKLQSQASKFWRQLALLLVFATLALPASAFRLIQPTEIGRVVGGIPVTCEDPGGFLHWNAREIFWRRNIQGYGATAINALYQARVEWGANSNFILRDGGNTNAGFATDGINTTIWQDAGGCSGDCLAVTALVVGPGQEILETDIAFRSTGTRWRVDGRNRRNDYEVESVAVHEFGHSLGIFHTELESASPRPTMARRYNFGWSSLEADDINAIQCVEATFPFDPGPGCNGAPATPAYISGPNYYHCQGSTNQYSTNQVAGTDTYRWEVVGTGFSTTSVNTNASITANFSPGFYTIRVRAENACGNSAWRTNLLNVINPNGGGFCQ